MSKKTGFDTLRTGVHVLGLFPLLQLVYFFFTGGLTFNPIQFITQRLGQGALTLLILSLAVTPIVTVSGWHALIKHRRTFGLYAFFYASLHFSMFAVVDYALDFSEINRQIVEKPYILMGVSAGIILLALAVTSFKSSMKRLGKSWKSLHRLVYLAGIIIIIHYAWALKGNLSQLSGNVLGPLLKGSLIALLLILRIPSVRKRAATLRQHLKFSKS